MVSNLGVGANQQGCNNESSEKNTECWVPKRRFAYPGEFGCISSEMLVQLLHRHEAPSAKISQMIDVTYPPWVGLLR